MKVKKTSVFMLGFVLSVALGYSQSTCQYTCVDQDSQTGSWAVGGGGYTGFSGGQFIMTAPQGSTIHMSDPVCNFSFGTPGGVPYIIAIINNCGATITSGTVAPVNHPTSSGTIIWNNMTGGTNWYSISGFDSSGKFVEFPLIPAGPGKTTNTYAGATGVIVMSTCGQPYLGVTTPLCTDNAVITATNVNNWSFPGTNSILTTKYLDGVSNPPVLVAIGLPGDTNLDGDTSILNALNNNNQSPTNNGGSPSNTAAIWTNGITSDQYMADQTLLNSNNAVNLNNTLNTLVTTNGIGTFAGPLSALGGNIPANNLSAGSDPGASFSTITLGAGASAVGLTLSTEILDTALPQLVQGNVLFKWAIVMLLILCNWKHTMAGITLVLQTGQARTAGQEVLGTNINSASALLMATAIIVIAGALPTIASATLSSEWSQVSFSNPFTSGGITNGVVLVAYNFLIHYFPIGLLVTAVLNHIGFRALYDVASRTGAGIVKLLVGL